MYPFESEPLLVPAPMFSITPPPSKPQIFLGPLGLRAGWGILLFLVLTIGLSFAFGFGLAAARGKLPEVKQLRAQASAERDYAKATHTPVPVHPIKVASALRNESTGVAAVLLAALALSYAERRRFAVYGIGPRHFRDLLPGALWGLAAMGLLVALLSALHLVVFDRQVLHGSAMFRFGSAWLLLFLLVGLSEEFLFRGYVQFTLTRGLLGLARHWFPDHVQISAFWMSAVLWSSLFFIAHLANPGENPAGLAGVFLAGILFSYALWRTGSLWWGIGFHMTWDWAQSFLFGVPDSGTLSIGRLFATHARGNPLLSGGMDGPEGSLLLIPIFLLIFAVIRMHPQAEQPQLEPESLPVSMHSTVPEPIA